MIVALVLIVLSFLILLYVFYPAIQVARAQTFSRRVTMTHLTAASSATSVVLSLVIPAYNEKDRLPVMLKVTYGYLQGKPAALKDLSRLAGGREDVAVEILVVDDGSIDATCQAVEKFAQSVANDKSVTWKLIRFPRNAGKGAAVQAGMLACGGQYALMVDADGATDFGPGLERLVRRLKATQAPIVLGSRAALQHAQRSFVRQLLMQAFHLAVVVLVGAADIQDTQCGFKLFARETVEPVFGSLHLRRWAFDTEVVFLAKHFGFSMEEVNVPWQEIEGSKLNTSALNLGLVAVGMFRDMLCVRLCYTLGIWKRKQKP